MPTTPPPETTSPPPWQDLPPDLLGDISGRLYAAPDYVHFHAVCKPWRDSLPPLQRRTAILPWLIAPQDATGHRKARCVLSTKSSSPHRAAATEICIRDRRWVISADDGKATSWLLTESSAGAESSCGASEPLTGSAAAMSVPRFPDEMKKRDDTAVGLASSNGTTILYAYGRIRALRHIADGFEIAIRHPGMGAEWIPVRRSGVYLDGGDWRRSCLAYRNRKIVICHMDRWRIEGTIVSGASHVYGFPWMRLPCEPGKVFVSSYLVESRGELLCVIVRLCRSYCDRQDINDSSTIGNLASALSVSVYALQEKEEGVKQQWVKRDGSSFHDCILFLGRPNSVALDGAQFGMSDRGCAYFVYRSQVYGGIWSKSPLMRCRLFEYSFLDSVVELVEQLPQEWADEGCTWITPQLAISSTGDITERVQPTPTNPTEDQPHFGRSFRIYVGNLPRRVDSYQLQEFFSKQGRVVDAQVMHERRSGRSRGFGFVTMATQLEDEPSNTVAKINGQCLDGRPLRVKLADQ